MSKPSIAVGIIGAGANTKLNHIPKLQVQKGVEVVAEALRPSADETETRNAAERLAHLKPYLVAMDCMSYTPHSKAIVSATVGVPTLLAITATGRVIRELLE